MIVVVANFFVRITALNVNLANFLPEWYFQFSMTSGGDINLSNCNIGDEELRLILLCLPYCEKVCLANYEDDVSLKNRKFFIALMKTLK